MRIWLHEQDLILLSLRRGSPKVNVDWIFGDLHSYFAKDMKNLTGTKDLAAANNNVAIVHEDCLTVASDHETTVAARPEALMVIANDTRIAISSWLRKRIEEAEWPIVIEGVFTWVTLCFGLAQGCGAYDVLMLGGLLNALHQAWTS